MILRQSMVTKFAKSMKQINSHEKIKENSQGISFHSLSNFAHLFLTYFLYYLSPKIIIMHILPLVGHVTNTCVNCRFLTAFHKNTERFLRVLDHWNIKCLVQVLLTTIFCPACNPYFRTLRKKALRHFAMKRLYITLHMSFYIQYG